MAESSTPLITADAAGNAVSGGSVIHDLGYRRYEGARDGARGASRALFWQGFRTLFGIGRPLKAKAIPVFIILVTMLPALGTLAAASVANGQVPVRYGQILGPQFVLFMLFMAAQAPEVLSRDQQHRVLPLMLTRDVTRPRYAVARLLAIWCAMLCVALAPLLLLWIGEIGIAKDPATAFGTVAPKFFPLLLLAVVIATLIGGVGAAVASLTPRRAYATAGIIGTFLVVSAVAAGIRDVASVSYSASVLFNPIEGLQTLAMLLFDEKNRAMETNVPPAPWMFVAAYAGVGLLGAFVMSWRIRKVTV